MADQSLGDHPKLFSSEGSFAHTLTMSAVGSAICESMGYAPLYTTIFKVVFWKLDSTEEMTPYKRRIK